MRDRWTRRDKRVMVALLSDASNLSGYPLGRVAQSGGRTYVTLAKMERREWVIGEQGEPDPSTGLRRRFYRLTPHGRSEVMRLLKLEA